MLYLGIKTLHVLAIISWMAAMLYLPRLFVYHADKPAGSETAETFKIMERRLLKAIMTPAMIVAWITGLWLAFDAGFFRNGWFHGKLALVLLMTAVHGKLAGDVRRFAADANLHGARYFRVWNEVPTLIMIGVVALVIIKPF
jgi:putative membrane protein